MFLTYVFEYFVYLLIFPKRNNHIYDPHRMTSPIVFECTWKLFVVNTVRSAYNESDYKELLVTRN